MKFRSIQSNLIRTFAMVILFTITMLGALSLTYFKTTLIQNAKGTTMEFVVQLNRIIENYITYMDDLALVVMNNDDVRTSMENPRGASASSKTRIALFLASVRSVRKDIDSIFLISSAGDVIAAPANGPLNPNVDFREEYRRLDVGLGSGPSVSSSHVENLMNDRYPWVISLTRRISDPVTGRSLGIIKVNLNYNIIDGLCRNIQLGKSGYVFIVNKTGEIVYHPRQQLIYGNLKSERISEVLAQGKGYISARVDGRDLLYSITDSASTGWTVIAVSYIDELLSPINEVEYYYLMLALVCFVLAAVMSYLASLRISRPIESLRRSMQEVESGNFDIDITVDANNEISHLARDCDIAIKKIRDLIGQNAREQEMKRKLELRALQAQINPHFLYNALDSIIWLVELGESDEAIDMTSSLAKFFRLGINRGSEIISIRNELEYIECYLSIQKIRYKNKLDYEVAFDPELYGYRILKLLIQPLIENAIYHGIKNKDGVGLLRITGEREGETILIRVSDNGKGMSEPQLEALRQGRIEPSSTSGVGVRNVQERIRLYFGPEYGIAFESGEGVGTVATIRIPVLEEEPS
jgi:two-component system, sensor histidine kinase YesM